MSSTQSLDKKMPILDGEPFSERKYGQYGSHIIERRMRWTARMGSDGTFGIWLQEWLDAERRWRRSGSSVHSLNALYFTELVRFMTSVAPRLAEFELGDGHLPSEVQYHRWRTSPETREKLDGRDDRPKGPAGEPGRGPSGQ